MMDWRRWSMSSWPTGRKKRIASKNHLINGYSEELKEVVGKLDQQFSEKLDFENQQDFTRSLILINSISDLPRRLTNVQVRLDELGRVRIRLEDPNLDAVAKLSLISTADKADTQLKIGQMIDTPPPEPIPGAPKEPKSKRAPGRASSSSPSTGRFSACLGPARAGTATD